MYGNGECPRPILSRCPLADVDIEHADGQRCDDSANTARTQQPAFGLRLVRPGRLFLFPHDEEAI